MVDEIQWRKNIHGQSIPFTIQLNNYFHFSLYIVNQGKKLDTHTHTQCVNVIKTISKRNAEQMHHIHTLFDSKYCLRCAIFVLAGAMYARRIK